MTILTLIERYNTTIGCFQYIRKATCLSFQGSCSFCAYINCLLDSLQNRLKKRHQEAMKWTLLLWGHEHSNWWRTWESNPIKQIVLYKLKSLRRWYIEDFSSRFNSKLRTECRFLREKGFYIFIHNSCIQECPLVFKKWKREDEEGQHSNVSILASKWETKILIGSYRDEEYISLSADFSTY